MKSIKFFIYTLIIVAFAACKGEKGDVGPIGDTGAKGAVGAAGQAGSTGATGATGATGNTGDQGLPGDKGATPAVNIIFSDWDNLNTWQVSSSSKFIYTNLKNYNLTMLPNYEKLALDYFSTLDSRVVRDATTKEPVGSFYVYYSIINPAKEEFIFSEKYDYGSFLITDGSTVFFNIVGLKTVPEFDSKLTITFSSNNYKDTDNFSGIISSMKPKVRFVYIPIGLPAKNGRKAADFKTYQELAEAYNIPQSGASY